MRDILSGEITKQLPDTMGRGELCVKSNMVYNL